MFLLESGIVMMCSIVWTNSKCSFGNSCLLMCWYYFLCWLACNSNFLIGFNQWASVIVVSFNLVIDPFPNSTLAFRVLNGGVCK